MNDKFEKYTYHADFQQMKDSPDHLYNMWSEDISDFIRETLFRLGYLPPQIDGLFRVYPVTDLMLRLATELFMVSGGSSFHNFVRFQLSFRDVNGKFYKP